ncbi:ribosome recycling factor [Candidatus Campbellbacteria bacterium CG11_big_fil_rev_8_21_14_0_20_44_21]|uniref:Ribosome recycling factor n=1 Tax=Candidatus Campbellbacteria bacterium CG22_combo_CG10-13_8_21_14_all_43_18 TaxID=1974530 RepID=A0A2H0DW42_9BACT|nr:MAG: ribosome recycling factor [Candidatus Campbellbacteria bacterium CG22_combo_CG10-13_8_21_14_all_43_18]PIR24136.1 MAG: ribosome recycling factor [Candidatus Campbellbacteria bacterium CG11_big_fil_rev_8_21_14_0_20_44_21]
MNYDFSKLKQKIKETEEWFKKELGTLRTGRATPAILDGVVVDNYGAKSPISQVAGIGIEDPRTLRISPYNPEQAKEIERGISEAGLGLSVGADDKGIRVVFPELTSERRESLIRLSKEKLEKARIGIRGERDDVWNEIQKKQKAGEITEDEKFKLKDEMQKIIDQNTKTLEEMAKRKETEIQN